jgi:hypothetical protein
MTCSRPAARPPRNGVAVALVPFLPLLMLMSGGCGGSRPAAEFVAQADALHSAALAPAAAGGDADLNGYLDVVGRRVVEAAQAAAPQRAKNPVIDKLQFHLVKCDVPNAVSTGGGHLYVFSGLLARCATEDDLAAALSLPVAHAIDLDLQTISKKPNPNAKADRLVASIMDAQFTPPQQAKALKQAAAIYAKGGWESARFAPFLSSLGRNAPSPPPAPQRPPEADRLSFLDLRGRVASLPTPDERATEYLLALPNVFTLAASPLQEKARDDIRGRLAPPIGAVQDTDRAN